MKKLSLLLIAMLFCLLSVGNAMAEEPKTSVLDRNAVWTNKTKIIPSNRSSGNVLKSDIKSWHSNGKGMEFDFIRETKSYDHANALKLST
jgi:hypothetical protein